MRITRPAAITAFAATALAGAVGGAMVLGPASADPAATELTGSAAAGTAVASPDLAPLAEGDGTCRRGAGLAAVADTIGISTDDLRAALRDHQTLAEIADANGVDPQAVVDVLVSNGTERLDAAVDAGLIDQATADERLADLPERAADLVNGELERDARRHPRLRIGLTVAADTIGIDVSDLAEALRDGQTVAEVADANGVDPQAVIDALVARSTERITKVVNGDTAWRRC